MRFKNLLSGAQSLIDLKRKEYPDVEYIQLMIISLIYYPNELDNCKILIIGLGGGILPRTIRYLYPNISIRIIEIDPIVNEMAKKYFYFKEDLKLKVFIEDGREFLNKLSNSDKCDIIYLDAYDEINGLPNHMKTKEFFLELKNHLNENGGLLIVNLVSIYQSYLNVYQTINEVFNSNNLISFRTNDLFNIILIASPNLHLFNNIHQKFDFINHIEKNLSINVYSLLNNNKQINIPTIDSSTIIYTDINNSNDHNEQYLEFTQFIKHI